MRSKKYACPNGCDLPPRKKTLVEHNDGTFGFDYWDFPFCPRCGSLMPYSLEKLKRFFDVYTLHPLLTDAVNLLYKSEYEAAAREAFITLENQLRVSSGLDLHGYDLAAKALNFTCDKASGAVTTQPLIAINSLSNDSDRNEQNGIRMMLMGFFQGPRNLYLHNHIGSAVSNAISVIIETSFFLYLLDGNSITEHGHWVRTQTDYREILKKMPKRLDRWKLYVKLKRRSHKVKKERIKAACRRTRFQIGFFDRLRTAE